MSIKASAVRHKRAVRIPLECFLVSSILSLLKILQCKLRKVSTRYIMNTYKSENVIFASTIGKYLDEFKSYKSGCNFDSTPVLFSEQFYPGRAQCWFMYCFMGHYQVRRQLHISWRWIITHCRLVATICRMYLKMLTVWKLTRYKLIRYENINSMAYPGTLRVSCQPILGQFSRKTT